MTACWTPACPGCVGCEADGIPLTNAPWVDLRWANGRDPEADQGRNAAASHPGRGPYSRVIARDMGTPRRRAWSPR